MYASVLKLSVMDLTKLKVADDYGIHKAVYGLFSDSLEVSVEGRPRDENYGVLYADRGVKGGIREILMVSAALPGTLTYGGIESKRIPEHLFDHKCYRFEVAVNPTVKRSGKVVVMMRAGDVCDWFVKKAGAEWGFEVPRSMIEVADSKMMVFKDRRGNDVSIWKVLVRGALKVVDRERFKRTFCGGVGRAKGFGCGLMQVTPLRRNALT